MTRQVLVELLAVTDKYNAQIDAAADRITKISDSALKVGGALTATLTTAIVAFGVKGVGVASNVEESFNKVKVALGNSSKAALDFAKTSISSIGQSQESALASISLFADMATGLGVSKDAASRMSIQLTKLSADLSSFKDVSIEESQTALKGIFTGETESLKTMGIVMNDATLAAFALSSGAKTLWKDMDNAEKVTTRYNYILSASKNAMGDFARTQDSFANVQRSIKEQFEELGLVMGQAVLPTVTKFGIVIRDAITYILSLDGSTKEAILGFVAFAAAIGPVLVGLGSLQYALPLLTSGFALLLNPITLVVTALAGLGLAYVSHNIHVKELEKATRSLSDIKKTSAESVRQETMTLNNLVEAIKKTKVGSQEYLEIKGKILDIAPEFEKHLGTSMANFDDLSVAAGKYAENLINVAYAENLAAQIGENRKKLATLKDDPFSQLDALQKMGNYLKAIGQSGVVGANIKFGKLNVADVRTEAGKIANATIDMIKELNEVSKNIIAPKDSKTTSFAPKIGDDGKEIKNAGYKRLEAFKKMHEDEMKLRNDQLKKRLADEKDYALEMEELLSLKNLPKVTLDLGLNENELLNISGLKDNGISGAFNGMSDTILQSWEDFRRRFRELELPEFPTMTPLFERLKINTLDGISQAEEAIVERFFQMQDILRDVLSIGIGGLANLMASGLGNMFNQDVKFDPKKMIGQVLESVGQMIIGIATPLVVALALGNVATFGGMSVPWGAAVGMLAAGVAMKGGGMAIGGSGSTTGSNVSSSSSYGTSTSSNFSGQTFRSTFEPVTFKIQGTELVGVLQNTNSRF